MANATDGQEATLEIIGGTVLVQDPISRTWIGASNKMRLREGDGIRTDEVSRRMVTLFDGSPIFLSPRTEVVIVRSQASKFEPRTNFVTLRVQRGYRAGGGGAAAQGQPGVPGADAARQRRRW